MFKLVVLSALLAVAAAKPGVWAPSAYSYGAYGVHGAYSPLAYSAYSGYPAYSAYSGYPAYSAYSAPVVSAYSAVPAVVASEPALPHGVPAIATKATGKLVDTIDNVVARDNHLVAKALNYHGIHKRSAIAPIAYSNVVSHATPLAYSAYSAPVVSAYSAYAAPAYSTYSHAPVVSSYSTSVVNPGHFYGVHAW